MAGDLPSMKLDTRATETVGQLRLLQPRTRTLDGTLHDLFTPLYPAMPANNVQPAPFAAAARAAPRFLLLSSAGIVNELEEAEIERQLLLRDTAMRGSFAQRYGKRHACVMERAEDPQFTLVSGSDRRRNSETSVGHVALPGQVAVFLKPSLGVRSEHRFQDTVEEHVSLGFPPDNRFIFRRSQFQGFGNTSTCPGVRRVRRKVPDPVGGRSSNTALKSTRKGRTKTSVNGGFQPFP